MQNTKYALSEWCNTIINMHMASHIILRCVYILCTFYTIIIYSPIKYIFVIRIRYNLLKLGTCTDTVSNVYTTVTNNILIWLAKNALNAFYLFIIISESDNILYYTVIESPPLPYTSNNFSSI